MNRAVLRWLSPAPDDLLHVMQPYNLVQWTGGEYTFGPAIHFISDGDAMSAAQELAQSFVENSDECVHVMRMNDRFVATVRWRAVVEPD
jgi:hypothetical protein